MEMLVSRCDGTVRTGGLYLQMAYRSYPSSPTNIRNDRYRIEGIFY